MPNLSENPRLRLFFLCSLYVAQGLPFGFVTVGLRDYLHGQGYAEAATGAMIAMVGIPWTFKFLWGPVIDRWEFRAMGKRRPWLLLAQTMMIVVILALASIPEMRTDIRMLGIGILILNIFIALQDVSTDSLAVDLVPDEHRGRANGFMYGSSYLGSSLGAIVVGRFLPNGNGAGSISLAFLVLAGIVFLIMMLPLFVRERPGEKLLPWTSGSEQLHDDEEPAESLRELFRILGVAFRRPVAILAAVFAVLVYLSTTMLSVVGSKFFVSEIGWKAADFSAMQGVSMWFSFGGSILAGLIVDRLGIKRGILLSGTSLGIIWILFRFCGRFYDSPQFVTAMSFVEAVLLGFMAASMFSLFMQIANKRVAATQFTSYMALLNLSTVIGGKSVGWATELIPSAPNFYFACGIFHLGVMGFLALFVHPKKTREISSQ